jgi:dihydropyrimidinase
MKVDSVLRGGDIVLPELSAPQKTDLAIRDGCVVALLEPGETVDADKLWDIRGSYVFPGAVDPHVHVNWPYLDSRTRDDYSIASRAAAAGGTTTIIDFAIEGRESPANAIAKRRAQAEGSSVVDFSFHSIISESSPQVLEEMAEVVRAGITSFKLYMTYRRRGLAVSDSQLFEVAKRAAELGAVIGVHAENADLDDAGTARFREAGRGSAEYLPQAKPAYVEAEAVTRAARIVAAAGGRLWILHLSSAEGLRAAFDVREQCGQPERVETCPQYLLLDEACLRRPDGHRFLCSPPVRTAPDRVRLTAALGSGEIDWVGTDHCLFLAEQKDSRADAFWDCPHGLPGVETRSMLISALAERVGVSLNQTAALLSMNAAKWFGLYPRKGTLQPGSDADLAVWNPQNKAPVLNSNLAMGGDWTPFEGIEAWTPPSLVMVRGEVVASSGPETAPDGHGQFLNRSTDNFEVSR